jgi:hypothetical protein
MTQPYPPQGPPAGEEATQHLPPHGQPPYGQVPYGQPSYGGPGATPPARNKLLPWLIAAGVALAAALAALGFVLLGSDDGSGTTAARATASEQADEEAAGEGLGDTDGDAVVPPDYDGPELQGEIIPDEGTPYAGDGGAVLGSVDRGAAFMDDVVLGDLPSALGHGNAQFQIYYGGDVDLLADEIAVAAGGPLPVNYTIDAVSFDPRSEYDILELTVELPDGTYDPMIVLVGEEGGTAVVVGFQ